MNTRNRYRWMLVALGGLLLFLGLAFLGPWAKHSEDTSVALLPEGTSSAGSLDLKRWLDSVAQENEGREEGVRTLAMASGVSDSADGSLASLKLGAGEGVVLQGIVLALDGGAAIPGATIQATEPDWVAEAESGELGEFEMRLPVEQDAVLLVVAEGYAPLRLPQVQPGTELTLELLAEGRLHGEIEGPALPHAQGGSVVLWDMLGDREERAPVAEILLDENGQFDIEALAPSEYQVCVFIDGFGYELKRGVRVESGEQAEVTLSPGRGCTLKGTVMYFDDNEPIAGAKVYVEPRTQGIGREIRERCEMLVTTDEEGTYEVTGVPLGEVGMRVETEWGGRAGEQILVIEEDGEIEQSFALRAPASLAGSVINESSQGVGFASVHVRWEGDLVSTDADIEQVAGPGFLRTETDINGRYHFDSLPTGRRLSLQAFRSPPGPRTALRADLLGTLTSLNLKPREEREGFMLEVQSPRAVSGSVHSDRGALLAGVSVTVLRTNSKGKGGVHHSSTVSDGKGHFLVEGLLPGMYVFSLEHEGFLEQWAKVNVVKAPAVQAPLEVDLHAAESLHGYVIDERGNSVPYAKVEARPMLEGAGPKSSTQVADGYGRFDFAALVPGRYFLMAKARGFESSARDPRAFESGSPIPATLELRSQEALEKCIVYGKMRTTDGGPIEDLKLSGMRGSVLKLWGDRFELQGLPPRALKLRFSAKGYLDVQHPPQSLAPGSSTDVGVIEFAPAAKLGVKLVGERGKLVSSVKARLINVKSDKYGSESVVLKMKQGVERLRFSASPQRRKVRVARLDQVPLGTWRLEISGGAYKSYSKVLKIQQGRIERLLEVKMVPKQKKKKGK